MFRIEHELLASRDSTACSLPCFIRAALPLWRICCNCCSSFQTQHICAGHNSKLRLLGISTVAGNQTVEKVTVNALGVVDAAGLQHISKSAASLHKQCQDHSGS